MAAFKQFLQNEQELQEGLLSRVTSFFKKPETAKRPQTITGKKTNAYRTHDDINPDDIPEFVPTVKRVKEEELDEGKSKLSKYGIIKAGTKAAKKQPLDVGPSIKFTTAEIVAAAKKLKEDKHSDKVSKSKILTDIEKKLQNKGGSVFKDIVKRAEDKKKNTPKPVKEDELEEGRARFGKTRTAVNKNDKLGQDHTGDDIGHIGGGVTNRKMRKASKQANKLGAYDDANDSPSKFSKVDYYTDKSHDRKNSSLKKMSEGDTYGVTKKATPGEKRLKDSNDKEEFEKELKVIRKKAKSVAESYFRKGSKLLERVKISSSTKSYMKQDENPNRSTRKAQKSGNSKKYMYKYQSHQDRAVLREK